MKKILLSASLICASFMANAQCTAVETLNETFENFLTGAFPQNCWTASTAAPMITVDESNTGEKSVTLYSFFAANAPFYLVTPELSTIDGNHTLTFDAGGLGGNPGTYTIQPGTLETVNGYSAFQGVGQPLQIGATMTTYSNIAIPASTTQKFIAFKIIATSQHMAASLDNVKWQSTLSVNDSKLSTFNVYPNPATDRNITVAFNSTIEKANIAIYNLTGSKVFETETANNADATNLNLSGLSSGIYLLKIQSGNDTATKKLILK